MATRQDRCTAAPARRILNALTRSKQKTVSPLEADITRSQIGLSLPYKDPGPYRMRRKKRRQRVRIGTAITMGQRRAHMAGLIGITSVKEMTAVSMHRWRALLVFVLLAFIIRGATFLLGSHDWDESLYVLGAESLLHGHLPYTQVWDHKPPGIFILFAAAIAVLREPVFAVRLLACVAVGVSSFCLWALLSSNSRQGSNLAGPVAGALYLLFSLGNGGGTANTEIFYLALLLLALVTITGAARAGG